MRNYYHQIYEYIEKLTQIMVLEDKKGMEAGGEFFQLLDLFFMSMLDHENGISIRNMVIKTGLKRNEVVATVKKLTEKGLLHKKMDPFDHRTKVLMLTEEGESLLQEFRSREQDQLFSLLNDFTFNEEKAILKFLVKMEMRYREK